jgi:predicted nucleic acid-binding protein
VVHQLVIPTAVHDELWTRGRTKVGTVTISEEEWIKEQRVLNRSLVGILPRKLHRGEREAIVLAQELGLALLVDDGEARKEIQRLGIAHFGSLRILKEAKERSFIGAVKPALDNLVRSGTHIGGGLYREFLKQVGESEN